jgi:hypothetical protein
MTIHAEAGEFRATLSALGLAQQRVAQVEQTAVADLDRTTAEKLCALPARGCRWPCGDPRHPDFHFCGNPIAKRPYCEHHRAMAYVPWRPWRRSPKPEALASDLVTPATPSLTPDAVIARI